MVFDNEKYSRRQAIAISLGLAGFAADSLLVANTARLGITRPIIQRFETGTIFTHAGELAQNIQSRFQVVLIQPSSEHDRLLMPEPECGQYSPREKTVPWDAPALKTISTVMDQLHSSFYQPTVLETGEVLPLQLACVDFPVFDFHSLRLMEGSSYAVTKKLETGGRAIVLSRSRLDKKAMNDNPAERVVVHELAHNKTTRDLRRFINLICEPLDVAEIKKLRRVFDSELRSVEERVTDDCDNPTGEVQEVVKHKSRLGYGALKFGEFFSVASEYYYQGPDKFQKMYQPFFKKRTDLFYQLMQEHMFEGHEFKRAA